MERINLKELSQLCSDKEVGKKKKFDPDKHYICNRYMYTIIKRIFSVIVENIDSGNIVHIHGLGNFKTINVNGRRAINFEFDPKSPIK